MSYWLIAVPNQGQTEKQTLEILNANSQARNQSRNVQFRIPQLKVGTLDTLMTLSDDLAKYDTQVGTIAKKIEKTYFDQTKIEQDETAQAAAAAAIAAGNKPEKAASTSSKPTESEQLKVNNQSAREFVEKFVWNETRYPKKSPLRILADLIVKEAIKNDDALKKQVSEYNEIRTSYAALERKDTGSLLVKPLGGLINQNDLIEKPHLTTIVVIVPKSRQEEWLTSYELMEREQREKEVADQARKEEEKKQRELIEKDKASKLESSTKNSQHHAETKQHDDAEDEEKDDKEAAERAAEQAIQEEARRKVDAEREAERIKMKKLKCGIIVPRSAKLLHTEAKDDLCLYRIVVLRDGAEYIRQILRERRYTVRPYKYDPEEEKQEKEKKSELFKKKKIITHIFITFL